MILDEEERARVCDRLEGWELVEFLQVPIEEVLTSALQEGWITEESCEEVMDYVGGEVNEGDR